MASISKDILQLYLQNFPLVQAIRQKSEIDETRKALKNALDVMKKSQISEAALSEVNSKVEEYNTISKNYGNMIEDSWHITWQTEAIIRKYIDCRLNELPEFATF